MSRFKITQVKAQVGWYVKRDKKAFKPREIVDLMLKCVLRNLILSARFSCCFN